MGLLDRFFKRDAPNRRLEELMTALARTDTPRDRAAFYRELLSASLRIATPARESWQGIPAGQEVVVSEKTEVRFLASRGPDGNPGMLAFTGDEGILAWRKSGCDTIEMPVRDLCRMALDAGLASVIINPNGPSGGWLRRQEISALAEGRAPEPLPIGEKEALPNGTSISLSRPPEPPPPAMTDALRAEAASRTQIQSLHLVQGAVGRQAPAPMLTVELLPGTDPDLVIPAFLEASARRLAGFKLPDVLPLKPDSPLLRAAREQGYPVFSRTGDRPSKL
ncbi:MAG: SseB family protein [Elusimicrobiota bacterium]